MNNYSFLHAQQPHLAILLTRLLTSWRHPTNTTVVRCQNWLSTAPQNAIWQLTAPLNKCDWARCHLAHIVDDRAQDSVDTSAHPPGKHWQTTCSQAWWRWYIHFKKTSFSINSMENEVILKCTFNSLDLAPRYSDYLACNWYTFLSPFNIVSIWCSVRYEANMELCRSRV